MRVGTACFANTARRREKVAALGISMNPQIILRFGSAISRFLRSSVEGIRKKLFAKNALRNGSCS
jgi:hypothetical protein